MKHYTQLNGIDCEENVCIKTVEKLAKEELLGILPLTTVYTVMCSLFTILVDGGMN